MNILSQLILLKIWHFCQRNTLHLIFSARKCIFPKESQTDKNVTLSIKTHKKTTYGTTHIRFFSWKASKRGSMMARRWSGSDLTCNELSSLLQRLSSWQYSCLWVSLFTFSSLNNRQPIDWYDYAASVHGNLWPSQLAAMMVLHGLVCNGAGRVNKVYQFRAQLKDHKLHHGPTKSVALYLCPYLRQLLSIFTILSLAHSAGNLH